MKKINKEDEISVSGGSCGSFVAAENFNDLKMNHKNDAFSASSHTNRNIFCY